MTTKQFQVILADPEREYVKVYKDFLNNQLLTVEEKMVFIALKSFVTYGQDSGKVFPSIETLCKLTSLSKPRATRTITSLEKKGVIKKTRRGLTKTNIYTLVDVSAMWGASTEEGLKELSETKIQLSTEEMLAELERRGVITITKEKEPETLPTDQSSNDSDHKKTIFDMVDNTTDSQNRQELYSLDQIKKHYDYETIIQNRPYNEKEIDTIMRILYDVIHSSKPTIRLYGEDKPTDDVIKALKKLTYSDIIHCIDNYIEVSSTTKIKNCKAYMRTMLYDATDLSLNIANQVQYDMANWSEITKE